MAPKRDAESAEHRALRVYFSYERARSDEVAFTDKIRVFLRIYDEQIQSATEPLVAEVKITPACDLQSTQVVHCPVSLTRDESHDYALGVFEITNTGTTEPIVEPASVYRLFVNLRRESGAQDEASLWGRVPSPYYVATSGETPLEKARREIVMRTFSEWYCTECGWRRSGGYAMDCHDYYRWATAAETVGSTHGRANLDRLFGGDYRNGSQIKDLTKETAIHADYVRQPGHTFMLLGYDPKSNEVLTMEGNFNSTIEVVIRSVSSGWTVGHLGEDDIRSELFEQPAQADDHNDGSEMADG